MPREPAIGKHDKVSAGLSKVRRMTVADPIVSPEVEAEADGSVQVGDGGGWASAVFDYTNNGFKGATSTTAAIIVKEKITPSLDVAADLLEHHRTTLKDLARRPLAT